MKLMKQIIATINKVETEKNPRPPTYVDPNKTIVASYSQGNELAFGQNAGQQCVAMSNTVIVIWGSKYLILKLEICMVEGSLKVHVFFSRYCLLRV